MTWRQELEDYLIIEKAIKHLGENVEQQPGLDELAHAAGLSPFHFQKVFSRWVGISPKKFLQFLTKERAKLLLQDSTSLLDASIDLGLSSPGRLYDLFVTYEAVTPGEYKGKGDGIVIYYGIQPSPFGLSLIAETEKGICNLFFGDESDEQSMIDELSLRWKNARIIRDDTKMVEISDAIFGFFTSPKNNPLKIHVKGSNFQLKVWEALLSVPPGRIISYEDLAKLIDRPEAARAVSGAVAKNPLSIIIPCHRVIRKMGEMGGYRWGIPRKKVILGWEQANYS